MQKSIVDAFEKNYDGSWTCIETVKIADYHGDEIEVSQGTVMYKGVLLMGIDFAGWLDKQCV